jgi:hypothetical protein
MTALEPREVERTFSEVSGYSSGLPCPKTDHPSCQDLGQLSEPFACAQAVHICHHCGRLTLFFRKSRALNRLAKTNLLERSPFCPIAIPKHVSEVTDKCENRLRPR